MNTLVIVLIAAVVLVCAYAGYGRWLAKTWGVDPNAKTPAVRLEDGKDYVPTNGWTVFAHQFSRYECKSDNSRKPCHSYLCMPAD